MIEDPGWKRSCRIAPQFALPWRLVAAAKADDPRLVVLRAVVVALLSMFVLIGIVVFVLLGTERDRTSPLGLGLGLVAVAAVLSLVATVAVNPVLPDDDALVGAYTSRFFMRLAFANAAALVGFVGFTLTWRIEPYLLGLVFAAVHYARLAPTAANLERDQDRMRNAGGTRNLVEELLAPPTPG